MQMQMTAKQRQVKKLALDEIWVDASTWDSIPPQDLCKVDFLPKRPDSESEEEDDAEEEGGREGEKV